MARAPSTVPLAFTAAITSDSKGPVNLTGLSNQGVLVVKLCCGRASIIFMSKMAVLPAFVAAILPEIVRTGRSFGASSASAAPEKASPASNRPPVVMVRRILSMVMRAVGVGRWLSDAVAHAARAARQAGQQRVGDLRQRQDLVGRAMLDGHAGHAEHHAAGFVLHVVVAAGVLH